MHNSKLNKITTLNASKLLRNLVSFKIQSTSLPSQFSSGNDVLEATVSSDMFRENWRDAFRLQLYRWDRTYVEYSKFNSAPSPSAMKDFETLVHFGYVCFYAAFLPFPSLPFTLRPRNRIPVEYTLHSFVLRLSCADAILLKNHRHIRLYPAPPPIASPTSLTKRDAIMNDKLWKMLMHTGSRACLFRFILLVDFFQMK